MKPPADPGDTVTRDDNSHAPVPVLVYHNITPRFEYSITRLSPEQFARQMAWLSGAGYRTIPLSLMTGMIRNGEYPPEKTLTIVFDDGYAGLIDHALPVLKQSGFVATVFPVAGYIGKTNEWDVRLNGQRLRHLDWSALGIWRDEGMEIGSHTVNHPDLTRLSPRQLIREITDSRRMLEDGLGISVATFSCPFGLCSEAVEDAVFSAGYAGMALMRGGRLRRHGSGGLIIPATGVYRTTHIPALRRKARGQRPNWFIRLVEKGIGVCAGQTPRVKRLPVYFDSI